MIIIIVGCWRNDKLFLQDDGLEPGITNAEKHAERTESGVVPKIISNSIWFGDDNNNGNGIGNDDDDDDGENDDDDYDGDDVDDVDDDDADDEEEDHNCHAGHDQDDNFNDDVLQDERSEPGYLNCEAHPGEKESDMLIMVS